jgi:hypothetical protein
MTSARVAGVAVDTRHWITRAHPDRVDGYVQRAVAAGAHPLLGGAANPVYAGQGWRRDE